MTRADIPEAERRDHFLYLDEFQSLVTPSTAIMLSESRKYRLCLTLSHQLTRQLDPATYHAVVGNCGTLISFRVGLEDAEALAPAMSKHAGQLTAADLCNLPNYTAYSRLLIEGQPSRPFSLRTLTAKMQFASHARQKRPICLTTKESQHGVASRPEVLLVVLSPFWYPPVVSIQLVGYRRFTKGCERRLILPSALGYH